MEKKNNNGVLIGILIGIIVMLLVFVCLFATNTISFSSKSNTNNDLNSRNKVQTSTNQDNKTYTYDEIKGSYTYETETQKDENGNEYKLYFGLKLYENGTFSYRRSYMAPWWEIGNYIIKDNTIVLNYLFSTNSGVGIYRTTGTKTIKISSNNSLIDSNPMEQMNIKNKPTSVTLTKDTSANIEDEFLHYLNTPISDSSSSN